MDNYPNGVNDEVINKAFGGNPCEHVFEYQLVNEPKSCIKCGLFWEEEDI